MPSGRSAACSSSSARRVTSTITPTSMTCSARDSRCPPVVTTRANSSLSSLPCSPVSREHITTNSTPISAPISFPGLVVMILLAYTIFTITLVLQRKEAARGLAVGLSTLTVPLAFFFVISPVPLLVLGPGILGILLWIGLRRPASRAWFREP